MTTAQYQALKSELLNDPRGYGYAGKQDTDIETLLNTVRDGSAGTVPTNPTAAGGVASGIITIKRADIASSELLEAIDSRDFPASPDWRQSWFESATQQPRLRLIDDAGANTRVLGNLKRILSDTNLSQTRLTALATRSGSRAEELLGADVHPTYLDVPAARNS